MPCGPSSHRSSLAKLKVDYSWDGFLFSYEIIGIPVVFCLKCFWQKNGTLFDEIMLMYKNGTTARFLPCSQKFLLHRDLINAPFFCGTECGPCYCWSALCVCVKCSSCPACYMFAALFRGFLHHIPHVQAMFAQLVAFCKYDITHDGFIPSVNIHCTVHVWWRLLMGFKKFLHPNLKCSFCFTLIMVTPHSQLQYYKIVDLKWSCDVLFFNFWKPSSC